MKHIINNTKKYLTGFSSLVILAALIIYFSGCSDSITNPTPTTPHYQAHSEQEFVADANLKAIPGAVIVINLEHQNSPADSIPDTGTIGEDIIPYQYTETALHHFRLGDSAKFKAKLIKDSGEILYELSPSNKIDSATIPAGSYKLYLTSLKEYGSDTLGMQTLFIQQDKNNFNRNAGGNNVDYNREQYLSLILNNICQSCDLSGIRTHGMNFYFTNLVSSNLTNTNFSGESFTQVNFEMCNLTYAIFSNTTLTSVNFNYANITFVNFCSSTFMGNTGTLGTIYYFFPHCWPPLMP